MKTGEYAIRRPIGKEYKKDQGDIGRIMRPVLTLRCITSREAGRTTFYNVVSIARLYVLSDTRIRKGFEVAIA
jgi:hypothetical protein